MEEERKVTGIDLEELRRAREEMYQEMGISSSPASNLSSSTNSFETNNEETINSEDALEDESDLNYDEFDSKNVIENQILDMIDNFINETSLDNEVVEDTEKPTIKQSNNLVNSSFNRDLSHYDAFAQFEINSFDDISKSNKVNDYEPEIKVDNDDESLLSNDDSINDLLDEINLLIEDIEDDIEEQEEEIESLDEIVEKDENQDSNDENILDVDDLKINDVVDDTIENTETEVIETEENLEDINDGEEDVADANINEDLNINIEIDDVDDEQNQIINEINETESQIIEHEENIEKIIEVNNQPQLKEGVSIENVSYDYGHSKVQEEPKQELLPEIDTINFVNVLSMQDFKNSDNFTFVLGRSERGNIIFESLKQCYNIAFFANEHSYELLNSMLLSFMLKNNSTEFKLALCDGMNANNFAYYVGSKYLYDSNIAKGEDEIIEKLDKIIEELESRYKTLAKFNVKSIDEYNILAKNTRTPKLSQILIVIDGYYDLMTSSSFERIKSSLYQILRLGRIAGIYAIIVTNHKIEEDIINFNLPSRIGFKCSQKDDSISMIGELGMDKLANKNEYFYSSINNEHAQHLRQPSISGSIIKILIDNIEN